MGSQFHSIRMKVLPERKNPTKSQLEIIDSHTRTAFGRFVPDGAASEYARQLWMNEEVMWSVEREKEGDEKFVVSTADVYTHLTTTALDHWLSLFMTKTANHQNVGFYNDIVRYAGLNKLQILPSEDNYADLISADAEYYQYIDLERGLYIFDRTRDALYPVQKSEGQPDHHYLPKDYSEDAPVPLDFFSKPEKARIKAAIDYPWCLCQVCQRERAQFGIVMA